MKAGMYDEALHSFLLAEEMDPENPELSRKVGDMFRELGDLGSALDAWNRSVQNETDQKLTDDLRKKRADAYSAMDMPEQGIRELMKIEYPGIDPAVELQKGELYSRLQDYSRAEEFFQNSLLSDPGSADASLGLANARICQGKIAGAEEVLDSLSSSSLDPDQAVLFEKLKKEVKNYPPARTDDISFLFSSPELLIMTVIGAIGIFYFRDKIFR
jgi:tetratricopeptide (TPR) repeat protein